MKRIVSCSRPRPTDTRPLMTRVPFVVLVTVAAVLAVLGIAFVAGMRMKSPAVQRAVKEMNKKFMNPKAMETAGTPGSHASVVHHVGRRSGTTYRTPVVPVKTDDGFVIALPYGPGADWVQNVLAAGRATITHEGETYEVDRPGVESMESLDASFGQSDAQMHRIFGVEECLRIHFAAAPPAEIVEAAVPSPG